MPPRQNLWNLLLELDHRFRTFVPKAAHNRVEDAFNNNLRDYKNAVPQVFLYNALIILSNGSDARLGSITSQWEHFSDWKKINEKGDHGVIAIGTMLRGTCDKQRLLDLIENFTLFVDIPGDTAKIIAKNHQYLGVNQAFASFADSDKNQGRLGVFWRTLSPTASSSTSRSIRTSRPRVRQPARRRRPKAPPI